MRTSLAIAAVVAVGGGAASAAAATLPHFLGSDTLFQVTTQAISACSAATGLIYDGTGSGNGESAMNHGTQAIAPMSRFLASNICTVSGGLSELQTAQGLVVGLDAVSVFVSTAQGSSTTCQGSNTSCTSTEVAGLAYTGSVTTDSHAHPSYTYNFANWKDVLAVLYGGLSNSSQNTATGDSGCNSDIRRTLQNHWGDLFQNAGCGTCTTIQHLFRRDDASGTSDVFASLVGLSPAPTSASNRNFGTSPYCNVNEVGVKTATAANPIQITTTIPHGLTSGQTVTIVGVGKNIDNSQIAGPPAGNTAADGNNLTVTVIDGLNFTIAKDGTVAGNGSAVGSYAMVLLPPPPGLLTDPLPTDYRDQDPIRIPCVGTTVPKEDVCNRDGNLGFLLPMVPTDFLGSTAAQYPGAAGTGTTTCSATNFSVVGAKVVDPNTGLNKQLACPNGEPVHGGNLCVMPVDSSGNTNCLNTSGNKPFAFNTAAVNGVAPGSADGRVYNSWNFAAGGTPQTDTFARPIVGSWYRIHQNHTIASGGTACTQVDATLQIGCLVQASPCSLGYAGRTGDSWDSSSTTPGKTTASKVNQIFPLTACVQQFTYALSRKLYLNTLIGWNAVAASDATWGSAEKGLADCEANGINSILTGLNFVTFPTGGTPTGSSPYAEDFNETMICPTQAPPASNANAVAFNANTSPEPTAGTVCGNGIKEAFEDCDDGTPNAVSPPAPSTYVPVNSGNGGTFCTNTCRWKNAVQACDSAGTNDATTVACVANTDNGANCHTSGAVTGKCQTQSGAGCCLP